MEQQYIKIRGARQHNLKNVNLDVPKNKLVVFTGVSGSGKSSLAFDTIYAEGQRRYVESLSTYARQFLGIMDKPDVDSIEGLSPAISIDQKTTSRNPRSTVGTVTEIYDYLRLLFARVGHPHCPVCGREITSQSLDEIVDKALNLIIDITKTNKKGRFLIISPIVSDKKGEFSTLFSNLQAKGYSQVRVDNQIYAIDDNFVLIKTNKHTIEAVCDKISLSDRDLKNPIFVQNLKSRLAESIESALGLSEGLVKVAEVLDKSLDMPKTPKEFTDHLFSEKFACPIDNVEIAELEPRTFSFNSPHGACPTCSGIGKILKVEPSDIIAADLSITEGGIIPYANMFEHQTWFSRIVLKVCGEAAIDPKVPLKELTQVQLTTLLYGTGDTTYQVDGTNRFGKPTSIYESFIGFIPELEKRHKETESDWVRSEIEKYMRDKVCEECHGTRLKKEALGVTINNLSIANVTKLSIVKAIDWLNYLTTNSILSSKETEIGNLILKEIKTRLNFLYSVGLEYLTLDRTAGSLSGGEAQRIRLASQIGSGLTGVLYVLDEPTIGLHQKDNQKLIDTLKHLRDLGNSVIVVEHDENTIKSADWIADFGPGAGGIGGEVVASGTITAILANPKSITGGYLSGKRKIEITIPKDPDLLFNTYKFAPANSWTSHESTTGVIKLTGCSQYNLKDITVEFPLGKLVTITGVSGSGKSTLLVETLYPVLAQNLNSRYRGMPGAHKMVDGVNQIDKVILIDQSPIGRTPRSNPATYTKVFDEIRDVFALTREAKASGYKKGRFSFNVKGGRCEACEGGGQIKIEMQFMSDIWVICEVCKGKRYNAQTLDITYKGKNIADVLALTVDEALDYFHNHPKIIAKLETLNSVGLGYMHLGQSATTLSGGEAQRVKLADELSKRSTGKTVYILDEPTTGLHFSDVERLLKVLKLLVARGNSVFVIEHNLDVIKNSDWLIDMGPGGGDTGGEIVATGEVCDIKQNTNSITGSFL